MGASVLGIGLSSTPSLWANGELRTWQVTLQQLTERAAPPALGAGLEMFQVLQGHGWGHQLAAAELDLLMPGGRVFAWTWNRGLDSASPIQMPVPSGTEIEVKLVFADGRRQSHGIDIWGQGGPLALSLTPGPSPTWCLEPEDDLGCRALAVEAMSEKRSCRSDGFVALLDLTAVQGDAHLEDAGLDDSGDSSSPAKENHDHV